MAQARVKQKQSSGKGNYLPTPCLARPAQSKLNATPGTTDGYRELRAVGFAVHGRWTTAHLEAGAILDDQRRARVRHWLDLWEGSQSKVVLDGTPYAPHSVAICTIIRTDRPGVAQEGEDVKLTDGELMDLADDCFHQGNYEGQVQAISELVTRDPGDQQVLNMAPQEAARLKLQGLGPQFFCPVCRRSQVVFRQQTLRACQDRGFCTDCKATDFFRVKVHHAFLAASLERLKARAQDPEEQAQLVTLRALYTKRRQRLLAMQQLYQVALGSIS